MELNIKLANGGYVVTSNGQTYVFKTLREIIEKIISWQKGSTFIMDSYHINERISGRGLDRVIAVYDSWSRDED